MQCLLSTGAGPKACPAAAGKRRRGERLRDAGFLIKLEGSIGKGSPPGPGSIQIVQDPLQDAEHGRQIGNLGVLELRRLGLSSIPGVHQTLELGARVQGSAAIQKRDLPLDSRESI